MQCIDIAFHNANITFYFGEINLENTNNTQSSNQLHGLMKASILSLSWCFLFFPMWEELFFVNGSLVADIFTSRTTSNSDFKF